MSYDFLILGIINITPDSFSDGGDFFSNENALSHCAKLIEDGVDILDLGAQSTRPGSVPIEIDEEWRRLEPVLVSVKELALQSNRDFSISIDTNKAEIALKAAENGVDYINNIRGLFDDKTLVGLLSEKPDLNYIAMHCHKTPKTMQDSPLSGDKGLELVITYLEGVNAKLKQIGFAQNKVWLDPGIGFGKSDELNLKLMRWCMQNSQNYQFCIGISRKSFLGRMLNISVPKERDQASKMLELGLFFGGIKMIRTHDVKTLSDIRKIIK